MTLKWVWNSALDLPDHPRISLRKSGRVFEVARAPADEVVFAGPAHDQQLVRAHDLVYVQEVIDGTQANGFGNADEAIVTHALNSTGVMIRAVREALDAPEVVVCAPVSGFHHAHYAGAEGYCTFNGLLVAIAAARLMRPVNNVLIIDGDGHYGNGTDEIIRRLGLSSITNLTHWGLDVALRPHTWHSQITGMLGGTKWDLVLYQAGADSHEDDPYGEGYLTDIDWEVRDRLIFSLCHAQGFPLVFNLAGGYNVKNDKTLSLHRQTVETARAIYRFPLQVRHVHVGE